MKTPTWRHARRIFLATRVLPLTPATRNDDHHGLTFRILCVSALIDDGHAFAEITFSDDREDELLRKFWNTIHGTDILIGHDLRKQISFLAQRSFVHGVRPSRTLSGPWSGRDDLIDIGELFNVWGGAPKLALDALADGLGVSKIAAVVGGTYAEQQSDSAISETRKVYAVFNRLTFQLPAHCLRVAKQVDAEQSGRDNDDDNPDFPWDLPPAVAE